MVALLPVDACAIRCWCDCCRRHSEVPKEFYLKKDFLDHRYHANAGIIKCCSVISPAQTGSRMFPSSSHHADIRVPCLLVKEESRTLPPDTFPPLAFTQISPTCDISKGTRVNVHSVRITTNHHGGSLVTQHMNYLQDAAAEIEFLEDSVPAVESQGSRAFLVPQMDLRVSYSRCS